MRGGEPELDLDGELDPEADRDRERPTTRLGERGDGGAGAGAAARLGPVPEHGEWRRSEGSFAPRVARGSVRRSIRGREGAFRDEQALGKLSVEVRAVGALGPPATSRTRSVVPLRRRDWSDTRPSAQPTTPQEGLCPPSSERGVETPSGLPSRPEGRAETSLPKGQTSPMLPAGLKAASECKHCASQQGRTTLRSQKVGALAPASCPLQVHGARGARSRLCRGPGTRSGDEEDAGVAACAATRRSARDHAGRCCAQAAGQGCRMCYSIVRSRRRMLYSVTRPHFRMLYSAGQSGQCPRFPVLDVVLDGSPKHSVLGPCHAT